jgi:hypothetical protein
MIAPVKDRLGAAEALIQEAAFSPVSEIPAILSRAVALIENVRDGIQSSHPPDPESIAARLKSFQAKLVLFSSVMRRSESIFHGYTRYAGISLNEYGPAGVSNGARNPVFFNLTV